MISRWVGGRDETGGEIAQRFGQLLRGWSCCELGWGRLRASLNLCRVGEGVKGGGHCGKQYGSSSKN